MMAHETLSKLKILTNSSESQIKELEDKNIEDEKIEDISKEKQ